MRKALLFVGIGILGVLVGFIFQPLISGDNIFNQVKKIDYVLNTAVKNYVDEVDSQKLVEAAIKGMLSELDPHSVYIPAEEMKKVNEDFQGSFDGIGIEFDVLNDTITVVSPIPGGPSEALGVMSGDKIIKIDDENAVGIERTEVPKKLRGPKGTIVKIDVKRAGHSDIIKFAITRDKIPLNTVDAAFILEGTDIGVCVVNRFAATTHQEMVDSLRSLKSQGMKKLILDLRWNPGGYLNQAHLVANEFLNRGDTIVYTKGRKSNFEEVYTATGTGEFQKIPLIVMINAGSASASEIVSGSIQDLDRGLIVGETSYGKGLVQRQYDVGDGSAFRLTISRYYTPSGRCIQRSYKDKDKYRHLAGRFEPQEGSYIYDAYDKIKWFYDSLNVEISKTEKKTGKKGTLYDIDSLPLYKTERGRTVFGGGGITPDYVVNMDTITKLGQDIRRKNLFLEFVNNYMGTKGDQLRTKYRNNFSDFYSNYKVDAQMIADFRKLAERKEIKWDESLYKIDEDYLKTSIKAFVAGAIWNRNRKQELYFTMDRQLNKAKDLFPDAAKIAKLK